MWMMERFQLRTFLLWRDGCDSHFKRTSWGSMNLRHVGASPVVPLMLMPDGNEVAAWWRSGLDSSSPRPAVRHSHSQWVGWWLERNVAKQVCFDPWCWQSFGRNWLQIGPTSEWGCPSTAVPQSLSWSTPSVLPSSSTTHDSSLPLMHVGSHHIFMFLFK